MSYLSKYFDWPSHCSSDALGTSHLIKKNNFVFLSFGLLVGCIVKCSLRAICMSLDMKLVGSGQTRSECEFIRKVYKEEKLLNQHA